MNAKGNLVSKLLTKYLENVQKKFIYDFGTPESVSDFIEVQSIDTAREPKQVTFNPHTNLVYVSCMAGKQLDILRLHNGILSPVAQLNFNLQCVEVETSKHFTFVTLTDFSHLPLSSNYVAIIDNTANTEVSRIKTGGVWPKFIRYNEQYQEILISNWKSNNVSVISVADSSNPKLIQTIDCGKSPRGIDFYDKGNRALVACYYSRNIVELYRTQNGYEISYISTPYDYPNYSGNMRDVIVRGDTAFLTNMGRNRVIEYSIKDKQIINEWKVGKFPNSLRFIDENNLVVSCRESNSLQILNIKTGKIQFVEGSHELPTGLCIANDVILSTQFGSDKLCMYRHKSSEG